MANDVQSILNSEEGKAAFEELFKKTIEEKGYKTPDEIQGLVNKRDELLEKTKKLSEKQKNSDIYLTKLQNSGILNIDDLDRVLSSSSPGKGDDKESTLNALQRELETERKTRDELQKNLDTQKKAFYDSKKTETIIKSLSSVGVSDDAADVLSVYFDRYAQIDESDGNLRIMADDGNQRLPLSDYINQWSKTEKAKPYIKAIANAGAGSTSSGASKPSGKMSLEQIDKLPEGSGKIQAMKDNGYLPT